MFTAIRCSFVLLLIGLGHCVTGVLAAPASGAAPVFRMEMNLESKELEVLYRGRRLATYRVGPAPFKPYVRELYSLDGVNVLLDAPHDHLHHHGIMYAVRVNGVNYWEETPGCGYQRPGLELKRTAGRRADGRQVAEIGHTVYWTPTLAGADPAALAVLVEERRVSILVDEAAKEVALEWVSEFAVGSGADRVSLGGANYNGLGLRFAEAFNRSAKRRNAAGAAYAADGVGDVRVTPWESMTQTVNGRDLAVTMFSDPANAREPRFFSMLNAFAYVSATQGLDLAPLEVERGGRFTLRYLVTVHGGEPTVEALNGRRARWLEDQRLSR